MHDERLPCRATLYWKRMKNASKAGYVGYLVIVGLLVVTPAITYQLSGTASGARDIGAHTAPLQSKTHEKTSEDLPSLQADTIAIVGKRPIFGDRQRAILSDFYSDAFRAGSCPIGLDKKQKSCIAPAYPMSWTVGRPLPPDLVEHEVPRMLVVQFGAPPTGHRYTRIAGDILLIALGTGMVVEAMRHRE